MQHDKLALIADVHGNLPALRAVIGDAKSRGATRWLLLGDYITDFPYPNEVAELLQTLENAVIIRGNKEERYANMRGENPDWLALEQMAPARWNLRELTDANADYLFGLPDTAEFEFGGERVYATHSIREICPLASKVREVNSSRWYRDKMFEKPFSRSEYPAIANAAIDASPTVTAQISALPRGVYAFGHNHIQQHFRRGDTLLVNPGSCGFATDFAIGAPYTMLTAANGEIRVEELRVAYDIDALIDTLKKSTLYVAASIWCETVARTIQTGADLVGHFLHHAQDVGAMLGDTDYPVSDATWRRAWATWVDPTVGNNGTFA
ncbi:MAG: metallophosphatase family protein [Oscillospiraceae bacterium]|jgi:predicted phosphodiesterase|nr:metallophosphatase family protein [Oscillospiraceae bacterium]